MSAYRDTRVDADIRATTSTSSTATTSRMRTISSPGADAAAQLGTRVARYGVAVILLAIGVLKFTAAEANGIAPLVTTSPLLRWMYAVWSIQGASRVIGVIEIIAAIGIVSRVFSARAAMLGSALAVATFVVTLSFFLTAPGVWDATLGFPFLGGTGQFIVKDIVLLGASLWSLGESVESARRSQSR
jgi:reactive chlorine resistance protein C